MFLLEFVGGLCGGGNCSLEESGEGHDGGEESGELHVDC